MAMSTLARTGGAAERAPEVKRRPLGPNWFAAVMGTGIVATAAAGLPVQLPGQRWFAHLMWLAASGLLLVLGASYLKRGETRAHAEDPLMAQFFGAPPMALMTVGGGALLVGHDWLGMPAAVRIDLVLWALGTVGGLITAVTIPYLMITRHEAKPEAAWLMPVVPPMVSAANGALLVPHLPQGEARLDLLLGCYALFGVSLLAALLVIGQLYGRLMTERTSYTPTLWIVLGPLGQSITAANLLAVAAPAVLPEPYAAGAETFALLYGVPVWGFALVWAGLAAALTIKGKPSFGLPWWSFTFPVGTVVTGTTGLAARTGSHALTLAAAAGFLLLLTFWAVVATRTAYAVWCRTI
jgi:tellurite resistance protein TehA-like permease